MFGEKETLRCERATSEQLRAHRKWRKLVVRLPTCDHEDPVSFGAALGYRVWMSESRSLRTGKDAREVAGIRRFLDHLVHRVLHAETRVELAANDRKGPISVVGQVFQFVVGLSSLDALCHFRRNSPARQRSQYVSESGDGAREEMQRYAPSLKRVVLEHFENRHENVGPLS